MTTGSEPVLAPSRRRIGIVDDHETTIRGVRAMIDDATGDDLAFAAGAGTVRGLLDATRDLDLVLLDLRLGDDSTPESNIAALRETGAHVLVFTSGDDPYLVRSASAAGVLGVIRKNLSTTETIDAIRDAAAGRAVPTMEWAAALDSDPGFVDLTPRLREVLELYAEGIPTPRVAERLHLSVETVNTYVDRIRQRYRAVDRPAPTKVDLFKRAIEDGWLPIPRRFRG